MGSCCSGANLPNVVCETCSKEELLPKITNGYWTGPHDVRVPNYVEWVMAEDGGNNVYKGGGTTEMAWYGKPPTAIEYRTKYAVQDSNGIWWYNKTHCDNWLKDK